MNGQNPKPGDRLLVAFADDNIQAATVLQYEEVPLPGACDMATEYLMLDIEGYGNHTLTRHSILPETDQEWCVTTLEDEPMVYVFPDGPDPKVFIRRIIEELNANRG
jgi:hypothetical protein